MDRVSFELLILKTQPKNLVLVNGSDAKVNQIVKFCESNQVETKVLRANKNRESVKFATSAGVKQVFIENQLLKSLALQKVAHKRFEISRIRGEIHPQLENALIFDELEAPRTGLKGIEEGKTQAVSAQVQAQAAAKQKFERKSLFLMSKEYRLAELQQFLAQQHNIQTCLLDKSLSYQDKIHIYLDKDTKQIKLEGFICPEYFAIRKLIYAHFGRI